MAAPMLAAEGSVAAVTSGNLTVTLPAHQANDILVACVVGWVPNTTSGTATLTAPSGWTKAASDTLITSGIIDGEWAIFWRRAASSSETNPTFTRPSGWDTGTDTCFAGRAYVVRGCVTTGDPWDQIAQSPLYSTANGAVPAVTVSGSERTVIQFFVSSDDLSAGSVTGWTAGTAATTTTGTDAGFQTFRKENVSSSTSADASTASAPAQGRYIFFGASFVPAPAPITGNLSQTLGAATLSASGQVSVSGSLSSTLGAATGSAAGSVAVAGSLSSTLGTATLSASGGVQASGSLSSTLSAATLSASGTVGAAEITGNLSQTLGAATLSGSGGVQVAGSLTATLGSATLSGSGGVTVGGTLSSALGAATLSSSGAVEVSGQASVGLAAASLSASGSVGGGEITGQLSVTLASAAVSASGAVEVSGSLSVTLGSAELGGHGSTLPAKDAFHLLLLLSWQAPGYPASWWQKPRGTSAGRDALRRRGMPSWRG
jgi:hypothetical protein